MAKRTVRLDQGAINKMLKGRGGEVNRVMGGLAGVATRTVREVANERVKRRTGAYLAGIKATLISPATLQVEATAPHSAILEHGSKPHQIVPLRASALRFEVGSQVVFARSVNHPGTRPYNILRDGVRRAGTQLNRVARG